MPEFDRCVPDSGRHWKVMKGTMSNSNRFRALVFSAVFAALPTFGQLADFNSTGVRMGHIHLVVKDPDAHKQFYTLLRTLEERSVGVNSVSGRYGDAAKGGTFWGNSRFPRQSLGLLGERHR